MVCVFVPFAVRPVRPVRLSAAVRRVLPVRPEKPDISRVLGLWRTGGQGGQQMGQNRVAVRLKGDLADRRTAGGQVIFAFFCCPPAVRRRALLSA